MQLHQNFARGFQVAARSASFNPGANDFYTLNSPDLVAYDRVDLRSGASNDGAGVVALVMINDNFANEVGESITTRFPPGSYLWQYARGAAANGQSMNGFPITVGDAGHNGRGLITANVGSPNGVKVPAGGYYIFSWKNPDPAPAWTSGGGNAIEIYQNARTARTAMPDSTPTACRMRILPTSNTVIRFPASPMVQI